MTIDDIILLIKQKNYTKFPKLLHSFWEELWTITQGKFLSLEEIKANILNLPNLDLKYFDYPPENSPHYDSKSIFNIGLHFLEILNLMIERKDVCWLISNTSHENNEEKWKQDREKSQLMIDWYGPKKFECGLLWKNATIDGQLVKFLKEVKKHHVVLIGMKHLEKTSLPFEYQFIPVKMPLRNNIKELNLIIEENHKKFNGETTIYLSQMSTDGTSIVCNANLNNCFFFDLGRVLDVFADKDKIAKPQPWLEGIPISLMNFYENPILRI